MDMLALITVLLCSPHDESRCITIYTRQPTDCVPVSDELEDHFEAAGFRVDTRCTYTHAPATSLRPVARPTQPKGNDQ